MPVIAFANQKGGVGKTTLNVNFAGIMAESGYSTLVIDADPQCNTTSYFLDPNLPAEETLAEVYDKPITPEMLQRLIRTTRIARLYLIPGGFSLSASVWEIIQDPTSGQKINKLVQTVMQQKKYDFIFIDCPPDIGIYTMGAFFAADYVVIPIQPEKLAVDGVGQLMEKIQQFWGLRNEKKPEILGTVTTMFQGGNKSHKDWAEKIKEICGETYLGLIHRSSVISTACDAGILLQEDRLNRKARPFQQHIKIVREILARLGLKSRAAS